MTAQNYMCWLEDADEANAIAVVDVDDPGFAASCACDEWQRRGEWSGDPVPDIVTVNVRCWDGLVRVFDIEPQWEVEFYVRREVTK